MGYKIVSIRLSKTVSIICWALVSTNIRLDRTYHKTQHITLEIGGINPELKTPCVSDLFNNKISF